MLLIQSCVKCLINARRAVFITQTVGFCQQKHENVYLRYNFLVTRLSVNGKIFVWSIDAAKVPVQTPYMIRWNLLKMYSSNLQVSKPDVSYVYITAIVYQRLKLT